MNNSEEKKKRAAKTTRRQYELYLEELRANKAFREKKFNASQPNIIDESWENLSQKLNSSGGPVKSVQEWKRVFTYWKSQVKSKARDLKVAQQETGNKEDKIKPLNDLESILLDIIGHVVVDGMSGVAQFGIGYDQHIQTIYKTHIQDQKSMKSNYKSFVNLRFDENNAPMLTATINPNNEDLEIINDEDVIVNESFEKKSKINNDIVQKQFPKKKHKNLTGWLRELVGNNAKETQQFQVLCEIRNAIISKIWRNMRQNDSN